MRVTYETGHQTLGVTADNAKNNDTMVEELADMNESFSGAASQGWCFAHILNLVAKAVLRQFDAGSKAKPGGDSDEAEAERLLADLLTGNDLEGFELDDKVDTDGDDEVDDDVNAWVDAREDLSEEEREELRESVLPMKLVLAKVSMSTYLDLVEHLLINL